MAKTALIVDDSRVVRKIARKILEELSFTCEEAENGQEAFDQWLKFKPAMVLLDWNMPVMNGLEFLKKLRQHPGGDEPCVIFCTTENDMDHIMQGMQAGANEYIMKPFDRAIIEDKLRQTGLVDQD